jgi:hypothetical protein
LLKNKAVKEKPSQELINRQYDNWYKEWLSSNGQSVKHLNDNDKRKEFQKYVDRVEKYCQQKDKERREKEHAAAFKRSTSTCYECLDLCTIL